MKATSYQDETVTRVTKATNCSLSVVISSSFMHKSLPKAAGVRLGTGYTIGVTEWPYIRAPENIAFVIPTLFVYEMSDMRRVLEWFRVASLHVVVVDSVSLTPVAS